jgi:hypothetical protein
LTLLRLLFIFKYTQKDGQKQGETFAQYQPQDWWTPSLNVMLKASCYNQAEC